MPRFVIQKHDARKLHYDFRLEMDGVLKSWAVPKAPSKTSDIKRLAIQVEDHGLDYINFEGNIEEGSYGAGRVGIWDKGIYEIETNRPEKIVFHLRGKKLDGRYTLLKMKWGKDQWLLFKTKKEEKIRFPSTLAIIVLLLFSPVNVWSGEMEIINLPKPKVKSVFSVEEAIQKRRSVRSYSSKEISVEDISQLLWACQGITDERHALRASPSAGALYPLEIYLVKKDGIFHYIPDGHKLEPISDKDAKKDLAHAAYGQACVEEAGIDIVICVVCERVTSKYGERGVRYTDMEAGHAAQNVFLQAEALGLASVPVGAFNDAAVAKTLGLPAGTKPLYVLPVGYKKR